MDTSYLLARLFGITLIVLYGGILVNRKYYQRVWQDVLQQPLLLLLSGFITLVLGLLVLEVHPFWSWSWRGLITFLGWVMVFAGVMRIVFPELVIKTAKKVVDHKNFLYLQIAASVMLLLGLYLTYIGFSKALF